MSILNKDDDIPELALIDEAIPELALMEGIELAPIENKERRIDKVPVTIITGFLGSGKTTLLQRLLNDPHHKKRIAVIMNEYGASGGIDKSLIKNGDTVQNWLELENGCLCCSVKDPGVRAIEELMLKKGKFDYIVLETTGMADPGPIASIFWLDSELQSDVYLDGIVTVVDAKNIQHYLGQASTSVNEATRQIALADRILINKSDLVTFDTLESLTRDIRQVNAISPILQSQRGNVPIEFLLDLHCFDDQESDPFAHILSIHSAHNHTENKKVSTISIQVPGIVNPQKLDEWLRSILWDKVLPHSQLESFEILRIKGWANVPGENRLIIQAVRDLYESSSGKAWGNESRSNKIVLIGQGVLSREFNDSFTSSCL